MPNKYDLHLKTRFKGFAALQYFTIMLFCQTFYHYQKIIHFCDLDVVDILINCAVLIITNSNNCVLQLLRTFLKIAMVFVNFVRRASAHCIRKVEVHKE